MNIGHVTKGHLPVHKTFKCSTKPYLDACTLLKISKSIIKSIFKDKLQLVNPFPPRGSPLMSKIISC